jgi:hypothetical protein
VNQVVSLGYTPVYNITKACIDFFIKGCILTKYFLTTHKKSQNLKTANSEKEIEEKTKT